MIEHPNQEKYKGQKMSIIRENEHAYLVPLFKMKKKYF